MKLLNFSFLCGILAVTSTVSVAQRFPGLSAHQEQTEPQAPLFYEAQNFISQFSGKGRVDVLYRIPQTFFISIKNPSNTTSGHLLLRPEISVELRDTSGSVTAHDLRREDIEASMPGDSSEEPRFIQGGFSFDVPPSDYSIIIEVNDRESSRHFIDNKRKITVRDFSKLSIALSDVLFFYYPSSYINPFMPINFGGDIPFGEKIRFFVEVLDKNSRYTFSLSSKIIAVDSGNHAVSMNKYPWHVGSAAPLTMKNDSSSHYTWMIQPGIQFLSYLFPIAMDELPEGEYLLQLTAVHGNDSTTTSQKFQIYWFDKPFTLRNPERAIVLLKYIASEDEMKSLKHGNTEERKRAFTEFWKKRDPKPETPFNELMAEYYRRADYATMHFNTFRNNDGTETDRGKAYLLYGPPTTMQRELKPSLPPREIWEYDSPKKRLIFIDKSKQGDYILLKTEERQ